MKTQTFVRFTMDYSVQVMCPPAKAGALMALLSECTLVTPEYMPKSDNLLVIKEDPLRMDLGTFSVVTKAEYEAAKAEYEAAKAAKAEYEAAKAAKAEYEAAKDAE